MKVSKLHSAELQMRTAIDLYKQDADPVSVHTLISSSHKILTDLNAKHHTNKSVLKNDDWVGQYIPEDKKGDYYAAITKAHNFFKHSNNPKETTESEIDFNPDLNDFYLLDAILMFNNLKKVEDTELISCLIWIYIKYPDFLSDTFSSEFKIGADSLKGNPKFNKKVYFDLCKKEPLAGQLLKIHI